MYLFINSPKIRQTIMCLEYVFFTCLEHQIVLPHYEQFHVLFLSTNKSHTREVLLWVSWREKKFALLTFYITYTNFTYFFHIFWQPENLFFFIIIHTLIWFIFSILILSIYIQIVHSLSGLVWKILLFLSSNFLSNLC